jgi:hypothetical protein
VPEGQAVLFITRVGYLESGVAVELTHSYCRSDYYDFVAEMSAAFHNFSEWRALILSWEKLVNWYYTGFIE